jgi:hypothetical protein
MSKGSYGTKAEMTRGDFHLRRDDRQMFGNFVVLSSGGGEGGPFAKIRRSATFVETPVYEVPKFWKLDIQFETLESGPPFPLSPWVPPSLGGNIVKVTVRQALDRDKRTVETVFNLRALENAPNLQCALPERFFAGHQIAVTIESIGSSITPMGVQVSLVELTTIDSAPYRNADVRAFAQSATTANFLTPNKLRRQFFVQNEGTLPLYLAFDFFAIVPGALAHYTVALPVGGIYESPRDCFQGFVSGVWTAPGTLPTHQAAVTEGF